MVAPKRTGLPNVPTGAARDRQFFESVKEKLEVAEGLRGDPLEQKLTWRDLIELGFAKAIGRVSSGNPIRPGDVVSVLPIADMAVPPVPAGFSGVGILSGVTLIWENPFKAYRNHDYAEIFRGITDDFSAAELIGRDNGSQYSDWDVQPAGQYYYWIRFVSKAGVNGPIQGTAGFFVEVPVSADWLLNELTGQITESHLFNDLQTRLGNIELNGEAIQNEITARADADDALAQQISTVAATAANAGDIATQNTAAIQNEQTARSNGDSALAQQITTMQTNVNGQIATVQQSVGSQGTRLTAVEGDVADMNVYWEVKTTVAGLTGGFGLYNDGTKTSFAVSADLFYVFNPATSIGTLPFIIQNGAVYMNTAFIKDASIDSAKIGSVTIGKIKDANGNPVTTVGGLLKADYIDVQDLIANHLSADFLEINNGVVSDTIKSSNYNDSSLGWQLNSNGAINCYNLTARGDIEASSLKASAVSIVNTLHLAGNSVRVLEYYDYSAAAGSKSSNSYLDVDSFTINLSSSNNPGVFVLLNSAVSLEYDEAHIANNNYPVYGYIYLQLLRGSTLIKETTFAKISVGSEDPFVNRKYNSSIFSMLFDSPPAGLFTYTIRFRFYNHAFQNINCSGQYTVDGAKA